MHAKLPACTDPCEDKHMVILPSEQPPAKTFLVRLRLKRLFFGYILVEELIE